VFRVRGAAVVPGGPALSVSSFRIVISPFFCAAFFLFCSFPVLLLAPLSLFFFASLLVVARGRLRLSGRWRLIWRFERVLAPLAGVADRPSSPVSLDVHTSGRRCAPSKVESSFCSWCQLQVVPGIHQCGWCLRNDGAQRLFERGEAPGTNRGLLSHIPCPNRSRSTTCPS